MKKRILSIVLTLCMVLTLLPATALAADEVDSGEADGLSWVLTKDGTLTISGHGGMTSALINQWSSWKAMIKSAVIEPGVTSIGGDAFYYCSSL